MKKVGIKPLYDRVIVRCEAERTTPGGIYIPDNAAEKPMRGVVVAVGCGKLLDSGDCRALMVKVDDIVMFGKYTGTTLTVGDQELVVMREDEILVVVDDDSK